MDQVEIDGFPVAQLPARYGVARSVAYSRLAALKIKTEKRKNKAYVSNEQLQLLDELDLHLKQKGTVAEFQERLGLEDLPRQTEPVKVSDRTTDSQTGQLAQLDQYKGLELLAEAIAAAKAAPQTQLSHLRELEEACQNHWLLSTIDLAALLKLSRRTINRQQKFSRYGFTFTRAGRNGTEIAWEVSKSR